MSVLEVNEASISFGGVRANSDVSIYVGEWEIVGIIGPNSAGKTTAFNIITGFYQPDSGRVSFRGMDVTGLGVHERTALGMGRTFQNVGMVKGATVRENLKSAQHLRAEYSTLAGMLGLPKTFRTENELSERAERLVELLDIEHHVPMVVRVCDYVYCLSFGQLLAQGKPDEVRKHPEVIKAYLGEDT